MLEIELQSKGSDVVHTAPNVAEVRFKMGKIVLIVEPVNPQEDDAEVTIRLKTPDGVLSGPKILEIISGAWKPLKKQ
jgi:hypothetical protein